MSPPDSRIWVDSDGVIDVGGRYAAHGGSYEQQLKHVRVLRAEHAGAWGDDESGKKFGEKFNAGLDALEDLLLLTISKIEYTSENFRRAGRSYAEADEFAGEVSLRLDMGGEPGPTQPGASADQSPPEEAGRQTNVLSAGGGIPHTSSDPTSGITGISTPSESFWTPTEPALPAHNSGPDTWADSTPSITGTLLPGESFSTPAFSAYDSRDFSSAQVDGRPLPDGARLMAFVPLPGGTVEVDANLYVSMTPVSAASVTGTDGAPIDAGEVQFFVVRDNPQVDPTVPGYQPLNIAFPAGGNPPVA